MSLSKIVTIMLGEIICKNALEIIFAQPFLKARPAFLKNPLSGSRLELDCYNEDLQIALEYQGIQHYKYTPFFHKTKDQFINQLYRDNLKRHLCHKYNILLIEIPFNIAHQHLFIYIVNQLQSKLIIS